MIWQRVVAVVNARVVTPDGIADAVRFTSRILSAGDAPRPGDVVIDARGGFVLPGLINAHDHLELNHYGRLKFRERYDNATEWSADMRPRLEGDERIRAGRGRPLTDRVLVGAAKNVLSGVTTVAHHNPFYPELRRQLPIRVLRRYGWAHSFALQDRPSGARGESGGDIQDRFRSTPSAVPFFLHVGEGTDAAARTELSRLHQLGCLASNTVLVHAVAAGDDDWRRVRQAGATIVWCPASNLFLLGTTLNVGELRRTRGMIPVALGTDSRLTGSRDLLDELQCARQSSSVSNEDLLAMVTTAAADIIGQSQLGRLCPGAPADLILVPGVRDQPADALLSSSRRDLELVVVGGRPMVANPAFASMFDARRTAPLPIRLDGTLKLADSALARRMISCSIAEPGLLAA